MGTIEGHRTARRGNSDAVASKTRWFSSQSLRAGIVPVTGWPLDIRSSVRCSQPSEGDDSNDAPFVEKETMTIHLRLVDAPDEFISETYF